MSPNQNVTAQSTLQNLTPKGLAFVATVALGWLTLAAAVDAQQPAALPRGEETQINSYTTSDQIRPAVAADADGNFVIVWQSDGADDASVQSALAQRFDSSGQAVAAEFRASFSTAADNTDPDIAMSSSGEFTIVWTGPNLYGELIAGQRYASDGSPAGAVFFASEFTVDNPGPASIAYLPDGGFVVTWDSTVPSADRDVLARRFDSSGAAVGGAFQVNSYTTGDQVAPRIAADGSGEFVIAYESSEFTAQTYRTVLAQRFDSTGTAIGDELLLADSSTGDSEQPDIDLFSGGFVLTWIGPSVVGDALFALGFDPDGTPLGSLQFPSGTVSSAQRPRIAAGADGRALVVWDQFSVDGDLRSIQTQAFDPLQSGAPLRPSQQVNVVTTGDQIQSAVAAVGDTFIVAWSSDASAGSDQDLDSVQRREVSIPLFYDGFETGTLSAWSMSVP